MTTLTLLAGAVFGVTPATADEVDVDLVPDIEVQLPSNDELREILADDPTVRVLDGPRGRATNGAVGAGIEITPSGYGPVWLGGYGLPAGVSGTVAFCTQARVYNGAGEPPVSSRALDDPAQATAEDAYLDLSNGAVMSAFAYLTHMRHEQPGTMAGGNVAQVKALIDAATPQYIKDLASQLLDYGARNAGPFSAPRIGVNDQSLRWGEVTGLGVKSASGQFIAGAPGEGWFEEQRGGQWVRTGRVVVDLNGNHRADPGEPSTWSGTSQSTGITVHYAVASGVGEVRFVTRWTGVKTRKYAYYDMGGARQNVIVLEPARSESDPMQYSDPFEATADFQLVPTSQLSTHVVDKGESFTDTLTTTLAAGDTWAEVDGRRVPMIPRASVYGPLPGTRPSTAAVPPGTPLAKTLLVAPVTGEGDTEHEFTLEAGGTYAVVWSYLKADQGAYAEFLRADASDHFMAPSETLHVKVDVELSSEVDERLNDDAGAGLKDWVTVSLAEGDVWPADDAGHPLTLKVRNNYWGTTSQPAEQAETAPPGAVLLGEEFLEFTEPGRKPTSGAANTGAEYGFVTWQAEVRMQDQSEEMAARLSGPVLSPWMEEAETTSVRWELEHASQMREWNVDLGGRAFDEVVISGFPEDHGDFEGLGGWGADRETADFTVYGPVPDEDPWWDDPVVTDETPVLMRTELPARNGAYQVGYTDDDRIQPNLVGCYVAIWEFRGDDRVQPFTSRADDVRERFCVRDDPSLWLDMMSTATQSATAGEGVIGDTVLVIGPAFPAEGASLTWEQCMWAPGTAPGCPNPVVTHRADVPRTGAYVHPDMAAPTIEDLPPGTLEAHVGWAPVLRDRGGVVLLREPWGTPSQTTLVTAELPEMVSQATGHATTGEEIGDQVKFIGATRSDWTLGWEGCWLVDGVCPDGAAVAMSEPVQIDPAVDTYDSPTWQVEVPEGTAPGSRLQFGWAPVVYDGLNVELMREDWGVDAQTTTVDHPLPKLASTATESGLVGDVATDTVTITGPVLEGSVVVWDECYSIIGDTGCRPDAVNPERGPVLVPQIEPMQGPDGQWLPGPDPQVGIVLPALGVGETMTVTGPDVELTDGGLQHHPGLQLAWMPQILDHDGQTVVAEAYGVAEQTTKVDFPAITTVTEAYSSSEDGPWYGDWIGDRFTITGDIFPGGVFEGVEYEPDTVIGRLYAWPNGEQPRCEGEPLATYEVPLEVGVAHYDTGPLREMPRDRTDLTYGWQETTVSRGTEAVSECGLAAETLRPQVRSAEDGAAAAADSASALAVTGLQMTALLWVAATLLAVGVGQVAHVRTKRRQATVRP